MGRRKNAAGKKRKKKRKKRMRVARYGSEEWKERLWKDERRKKRSSWIEERKLKEGREG